MNTSSLVGRACSRMPFCCRRWLTLTSDGGADLPGLASDGGCWSGRWPYQPRLRHGSLHLVVPRRCVRGDGGLSLSLCAVVVVVAVRLLLLLLHHRPPSPLPSL